MFDLIRSKPACCFFTFSERWNGPSLHWEKVKKTRKNKAAREADFNRILFDIAMYMIDSNVHDNT